ncbi:MAG TPA: LLM class flavin-dependent oxidoreductase [Candidatus Binataceae bacterium]|jgi:probable F420-dependent oxidoreductase|nr:LLM class flavin-dependent oxidoreductase [Candidatus Binataceae bacterium]
MNGIKIGIGFGQWQYGLPEPELLCKYAETAEAVGLDSIWLSDHTVTRNPSLDITCLFAMIAARTRHMKMGPSVLTLPTRHPVQVAKTYATLDYISGGRMIMAVGSGGDLRELTACGVPTQDRGARLDEGIIILRKLWSESHVTHHGRFYSFDDVTIEPKPHDGPLDIWIGGKSDAILKRTARLGDGWFPALTSPDEFKRDMAKIIAFGEQYGRKMNPREAGVLLFTYVTDDAEHARQVMAPFVRALPMPPDEVAARFVVGSAAECVEKIQRFVEAGCSKFVLRPSCPPAEVLSQIDLCGREILPHFM